jgi:hypothetical protein
LWRARQRLLLPKTLVRSLGIVEAYELGDEPSEMPLAEDEHVVEELPPERAHEPFCERVHVRATNSRSHNSHPFGSERLHEGRTEFRITVADEKLGHLLEGCLSRLLRTPPICRRVRDRGMNNQSPTEVDEEQHKDPRATRAIHSPSAELVIPASRSHTRTCGRASIVAFRACRAHHSSVGVSMASPTRKRTASLIRS